jgi:hypothetical protein
MSTVLDPVFGTGFAALRRWRTFGPPIYRGPDPVWTSSRGWDVVLALTAAHDVDVVVEA